MNTIYTKRLILRPWKSSDVMDFHEFMSDKRVGECAGTSAITDIEISEKCIDNYIAYNQSYAIVLENTNKVIGSIGIDIITPHEGYTDLNQRYMGYTIHPEYWGEGYATEAAQHLIKYLFEDCSLDLVWTSHYDFNTRSKKVIDKCGFTYKFTREKTLRALGGKAVNELFYKITIDELM